MNFFLRYTATVATLLSMLFAGGGCSDDDNGNKPPRDTGPITLKQVGKNHVSYHIEAEEGVAYRHLIVSEQALENFTSGSKTEEEYLNALRTLMSLDGQRGTGSADYALHDLDAKPVSQQPYSVVAGLKHYALMWRTDENGNFVGDLEKTAFTTQAPGRLSQNIEVAISELRYDEAVFTITPDPGLLYYFEQVFPKSLVEEFAAGGKDKLKEQLVALGARTFEFGSPSEWGYLDKQTDYVMLVLGIDADGNQTELFETPFTTPQAPDIPTENLVFDQAPRAFYYGKLKGDDGTDIYNFYFLLSDCPMPDDEYGDPYPETFPCYALNCDLYTAAPAAGEPKIPEGTYTFHESYMTGIWHPEFTWGAYFDEEENKTTLEFSAGTITVAHEGDGYRIGIDLVTEEDKTFTGTFTGTIRFQDESSPAVAQRAAKKGIRFERAVRMPLRR